MRNQITFCLKTAIFDNFLQVVILLEFHQQTVSPKIELIFFRENFILFWCHIILVKIVVNLENQKSIKRIKNRAFCEVGLIFI